MRRYSESRGVSKCRTRMPRSFSVRYITLPGMKGQVAKRDVLLSHIWGYDYEGSDRVVDNHIKKLRQALGDNGKYLKTVVSKGYTITERK